MNSSNHETDMWTIEDIQNDEQLRIREFPVCKDQFFSVMQRFAHCLPVSVKLSQTCLRLSVWGSGGCGCQSQCTDPSSGGRPSGSPVSEVALVGLTSLALSFVASGFHGVRGMRFWSTRMIIPPTCIHGWPSEWGVEV